jgi:hypothetical protein
MPGKKWKRSLKRPEQYEAIKEKLIAGGASEGDAKTKAARFSNAKKKKKK